MGEDWNPSHATQRRTFPPERSGEERWFEVRSSRFEEITIPELRTSNPEPVEVAAHGWFPVTGTLPSALCPWLA
jgi:hypothetical protein